MENNFEKAVDLLYKTHPVLLGLAINDLANDISDFLLSLPDRDKLFPQITFENNVSGSDLKKGDVFLWRSGMTGRYEIHTFHSDAGYGIKTFTQYNEKDHSSEVVNYSGVCGRIIIKI
jgi:hypothetical protein